MQSQSTIPTKKFDAVVLGVGHKEFLDLDIRSLQKDDFAVFIYIGHGRQLKIKNKNYTITADEDDGIDEALMCNGLPIYDDEIRLILNLNLNKSPVFIVIDACYNPVVEKKGLSLNQFSSLNEIAFSSTSENELAFMENFNHDKQAIFSSFLLEVLKDNLDKNYNLVQWQAFILLYLQQGG